MGTDTLLSPLTCALLYYYCTVLHTPSQQTITQTSVQYVRCLKPNSSKSAVHLENKKVTCLLQLLLQFLVQLDARIQISSVHALV
jgi:hypothetical protein